MTSDYNKALNLPKDMDIYLNDLPETKNYLSDMVLYNGYAVYLYKSFSISQLGNEKITVMIFNTGSRK